MQGVAAKNDASYDLPRTRHVTTACSWQGAAMGLYRAGTTCRLHPYTGEPAAALQLMRGVRLHTTLPVIVRAWRGYASLATSDAYSRHLLETVRPKLEALRGFRGLYLLSRRLPSEVEYEVLTIWDSMEAIRAFAGEHLERAVVEPEAAAVLTRFDHEVRHYEVIAGPND